MENLDYRPEPTDAFTAEEIANWFEFSQYIDALARQQTEDELEEMAAYFGQ